MMDITLKDFKLRFRRIYGVVDDRFDDLMNTCANEILTSVVSLEHIEKDKSEFEVLRELEDGYFVRPYAIQKSEDDLIDFKSNSLISALFYKCAMHTSTEGLVEYEREYYKYLNNYALSTKDEGQRDIKDFLADNKMDIPYVWQEKNTKNSYVWDKHFIENLDFYLADEKASSAYRYRRFVGLFKDFQNGKNQRADMKDLDKVMSERLIKGVING